MKIKIYIDVLFAVNVWMNAGLLFVTGTWFGYKRKGLRVFLGASVGAAWSCISLLIPFLPEWGGLLVTYGVIGPLMCRTAFGIKDLKSLMKASAGLSVITIFAGGFMGQIYFHTGIGYVVRELFTGRKAYGGSMIILFLLAAFSFLLGKEVFVLAMRACHEKADLCEVVLIHGKRRIKVTALIDTGNRLYEPATGMPVSIGEAEVLYSLCPEKEEESGFFLIPYSSIGGNGLLKGRLIDGMEILDQDGNRKNTGDGQVMVAMKEGHLSRDGSYQLILHGSYGGFTACEKKRRRKNGHQSISSKQISTKNHF